MTKNKNWKESLPQVILENEFVLTPIKNAFNNEIAYWISKKDVIGAMYYFTCYDKRDTMERITQKGFDESGMQNVKLFKEIFK